MINGKRVIGIIPARGGSKGLPGKNIRDLCGKPLIAWTIEEAKKSKYLDTIALSSDDAEIIAVALEWGCSVPFVRPKELARDDSSNIDVMLDALEKLPDYDYVVMLQPTSPLRLTSDIDACIEASVRFDAPCVSVTEPGKSPYWMYFLDEAQRMSPVLPPPEGFHSRQTLPKTYALNGAVYVASTLGLMRDKNFITPETLAHVMPNERSIDVDTIIDFAVCDFLMNSRHLP